MTIPTDILQKLDKATNSEVYDAAYGDFVYTTVETKDTLEDFKNNSAAWAERGKFFKGKLDDFNYIGWDKAQPRKGHQRHCEGHPCHCLRLPSSATNPLCPAR